MGQYSWRVPKGFSGEFKVKLLVEQEQMFGPFEIEVSEGKFVAD